MATATQESRRKPAKSTRTRYIGKPAGVIQARIQQAGPEHFAVISVDCAKVRSTWVTDVYHRPIQAALRKAGFDTRTVHPFASMHYRKPLHPKPKTDENDLEAKNLIKCHPYYRGLSAYWEKQKAVRLRGASIWLVG